MPKNCIRDYVRIEKKKGERVPFELVHLAVGLKNKRVTPGFLAGVIYPDIRYPAKLDRKLTHELSAYEDCEDKEFVRGARCHMDTDKGWDELVTEAHLFKLDSVYLGVLKLIHDRVIYKDMTKEMLEYGLPKGLPVDEDLWQKWLKALNQYLQDGPTAEGWLKLIPVMDFQNVEEFKRRMAKIDEMYVKLEPVFQEISKELYARIT